MVTPFITCQAMLPEFGNSIGASISKHRSCKLTRVEAFTNQRKLDVNLFVSNMLNFFSHVLPGKDLPLPLHPRSHGVKAPALRLPPSSWSHLPKLLTGGSVDPQKQMVCTGEDKVLKETLLGHFFLGHFLDASYVGGMSYFSLMT